MVQGWVDDPASNHGLVIASTTVTNGLDFSSSEALLASDRPVLTITVLAPDADGDGVPDAQDAFPNDPNESVDTDGDGIGNNESMVRRRVIHPALHHRHPGSVQECRVAANTIR